MEIQAGEFVGNTSRHNWLFTFPSANIAARKKTTLSQIRKAIGLAVRFFPAWQL